MQNGIQNKVVWLGSECVTEKFQYGINVFKFDMRGSRLIKKICDGARTKKIFNQLHASVAHI